MAHATNRPLSPHLSIYKLQVSMILSGLHRITGFGLLLGTLLFAWWIIAAAVGPRAFLTVQHFIGSPIGLLFLFGWTFCLMYHLCNGVRHLLWDIGIGIEIEGIKLGGWIMVGCAVGLTVLAWIVGIASW